MEYRRNTKTRNNFKKKSPNRLPKSRLIIGRKPLIEALNSKANIEKIFLLQRTGGEEIAQIRLLAKENNIPVSTVPQEKLDRFTNIPNQGVVAIAGLIAFQDLQNIIDFTVSEGKDPLIVVLDGITDTRNLGAITRSAHCFGAHAVVMPITNSAAITEDAIKTSAGALEHIPICRMEKMENILELLHLNGIKTVATALDTDQLIHEEKYDMPVAIIMGAEDVGVSQFVLKNAQSLVRISQNNNFDSLNVSVASGIALYQIAQSRSIK